MGNGTKRFLQIEKYICEIKNKKNQNFAILYYHSKMNGKRIAAPDDLSILIIGEITSSIDEIMYKI